jgi:hypothetical protein
MDSFAAVLTAKIKLKIRVVLEPSTRAKKVQLKIKERVYKFK